MAVAENAGVKVDSSGQNLDNNTASATETKPPCPDDDQSPKSDSSFDSSNSPTIDSTPETADRVNETALKAQTLNGFNRNDEKGNNGGCLKSEIKDLADSFSKLNPMAQEFVPPSLVRSQSGVLPNGLGFTNHFAVVKPVLADGNDHFARRKVSDDVRDEYLVFCPQEPRLASPEENNRSLKKITKLEDPAQCSIIGLKPRRADLDMNQHVNTVTCIGWVLESVPQEIVDTHEHNSGLQKRMSTRRCGGFARYLGSW